MLYFVRPRDTLESIAARFNVTINDILRVNPICNPNLIFVNQLLLIPTNGVAERVGGPPYYIIKPGDTLWCLYRLFNIPVNVLVEINNVVNPNLIYPGTELLIGDYRVNPQELQETWRNTGGVDCDELNPMQVHGIYYIGSFQWEALGRRGIPYLLDLLNHPCDTVRAYTAISLGRIGLNGNVVNALSNLLNDPQEYIRNTARVAIKRINLLTRWSRRVHVTISINRLYSEPNLESSSITLPEGTEVISLVWAIPSPTNEEGPRGGFQVYDYVQVINTGQKGYLPRVGFNEIRLI